MPSLYKNGFYTAHSIVFLCRTFSVSKLRAFEARQSIQHQICGVFNLEIIWHISFFFNMPVPSQVFPFKRFAFLQLQISLKHSHLFVLVILLQKSVFASVLHSSANMTYLLNEYLQRFVILSATMASSSFHVFFIILFIYVLCHI